jgi:hypothetical protein
VSRQLGLIVVHKEDFHCTPNFRNEIVLTYLVVFNFSVPCKFSKKLSKKKKIIFFRVKRTYAPDAGRTPLTQRFIKGPNVLKPYSFSFSLIFLTPKQLQGDFRPSLCDFKKISKPTFQIKPEVCDFQGFSPNFRNLGFCLLILIFLHILHLAGLIVN